MKCDTRLFHPCLSILVTAIALFGSLTRVSGIYQERLPSWQSNESINVMTSQHERDSFRFHTFTPLSSDEMDVGFRGSGSFDKTDPRPWMNLFEKLNNGVPVNIHVFGGSMTDGNGCTGHKKAHYYDPTKTCSWQYR